MMETYANLHITLEARVALLVLDHPPANTLSRATLAELDAALDALLADEQVKVIVITGAGQVAFAAGADIKEIAALPDEAAAQAFVLEGQRLFGKIESSPKPVIAAINGVALGGGLELALACHLRIVSDRARLAQAESNLGLIPGWGGTQRLPRIIGLGRAIELILTGETIQAEEALRLGLANKLAPADQLLAEAVSLAQKLAAKSKLTNTAALRAIYAGLDLPLAAGARLEANEFSGLICSHDAQEGVSAFLQKRRPQFIDS